MSVSLKAVLDATGGAVVNGLNSALEASFLRPMPLEAASGRDISFFFSKNYINELKATQAGLIITGKLFVPHLEKSGLPLWKKALIVACEDPYLAMAKVSKLFAAELACNAHLVRVKESQIHATAVVHSSAQIGKQVKIGPYCVVEEGAKIGDGCVLYPHVVIGAQSQLGADCVLFANVVLYDQVIVGDRARIHAGTTIGSDGFGYAPVSENRQVISHEKIFHLGGVKIGNDVEMGAGVTIDRGTLGDTCIEDFVKLDNQVHLAHNTQVEKGAIICGGSGLAGRARVGSFAYVGGMSGISNNVYVGARAQVGAMSLVTKDVEPGSSVVGVPQRNYRDHFRAHAALNRLMKRS